MAFVNTQYFSPVANQGITKAPKGSYEYIQWYKEEIRRCREGYTVGDVTITGNHYWYLNWWKIRGVAKGSSRKTIISPRFLDTDFEFFWEFQYAKENGQHLMVAKRRQVGATEKVASILGHEFTLNPASQSIIVAGEDKYTNTALSNTLRGLNQLSGSELYQQRNPSDGDAPGLVARYKAFEPNGKGWFWKGRMSELFWFTAKNNAQVVSSKSPSIVLFEECGVFSKLKETFGYVRPSLEDQGKTISTAIFLGTGGDMDDGASDFGEMFYNPELYNLRCYENQYAEDQENAGKIAYFIPGWKYLEIDEEGNSLKEKSIQRIHDEREVALKNNDSEALLATTIKWPLSPQEIFLIVKKNRFPQAKLNHQYARLLQYRELSAKHTKVDIEFLYDKHPVQGRPHGSIIGVNWELDREGVFNIFEFPELGSDGKPKTGNFSGTDSYDKDRAATSNSLGSCTVFNAQMMKFVARVTQRPELAEKFYEMTAKLCLMYGARNLIEWSNIRIFDWYSKMGLTHLLKERPEIAYANVINSQVENKYGVDPNTKQTWLNLYKDYQEVYSDRMTDLEQIKKALLWKEVKDYNCDITISSSLSYTHYVDEQIYLPSAEMSTKEKVEFFYYSSKNGIMTNNYQN